MRDDRRQFHQGAQRAQGGLLRAVAGALVLLWLSSAAAVLLESIWVLVAGFAVAVIMVGLAWWRRAHC
ncbi:MAG TPA: hypothetical protein DEP84_21960 [Chloroflexi bacterium]|nr:hypothetical protein [Chloroflexota bacterium]